LLATLISIDSMDETVLYYDSNGRFEGSNGNPTEVALLLLVHELGKNYSTIRASTKGRSDQGILAEFLGEGKQFGFSSARKMMSWAVPLDNGGYRIYSKGAQEVIVGRCIKALSKEGDIVNITEADSERFRQ